MKVYNEDKVKSLSPELKEKLIEYRKLRNFIPKDYINRKAEILNRYMHKYNLQACVVAVSGGIDSALVLSIISYASKIKNSPIKKIVPVSLPVFSKGAVNQDKAENKASELCSNLGLDLITIDITETQSLLKNTVDSSLGLKGGDWADGQLVAYQRTPTLYYITSLLAQENMIPILCGTTNKDEGEYLGYFGKASDGMVDVQLISDLHKSEVFAASEYLNVPSSIMKAIPAGDMYDDRCDEEVFGATYEAVELYLYYKGLSDVEKEKFINSLEEVSKNKFSQIKNNLENLHNYNHHKYLGRSPAVHFDIYDKKSEGFEYKDWNYYVFK